MEKKKTAPFETVDDCGNEIDLTPIMNKIIRYIWAGLGIACLAGVIFAGAWWHLFTAAICAAMYLAFKSEEQTPTNGR